MSRQAKVRAIFPIRLAQFLAIAAVFFFARMRIPAQTNTPTLLTNAADVLSLPENLARKKIPVRIRGVVTAAEPGWNGQFFVQDETSGVFVENRSGQYPKPGDLVEVTGIRKPGVSFPQGDDTGGTADVVRCISDPCLDCRLPTPGSLP